MIYKLAIILGIIAAILLTLIVLVQNPKGGGFAASFINTNQFGVAQTNKFLERTTWTLAIAILFLSIIATITAPRETNKQQQSDLFEYLKNNANTQSVPTLPAPQQQNQQPQN